ncbi:hypothetical protein CZ787_13810 [Halomonas citrativorans]|uniref:Uncharacterized protein n=1 Tax=Halomonas citrativorans TaxID=2742612 RepID=A0A1R4I2X4_9GAMM|nr:hypothetical protein CZ787_13810 [Halomonas citrativorans]
MFLLPVLPKCAIDLLYQPALLNRQIALVLTTCDGTSQSNKTLLPFADSAMHA